MTNETKPSISISDFEGGVHHSLIAGGNITDNVIQNIVVVGQFLDFAKIEELLPNKSALPDLKSIGDNFDQALRDHLGSELTTATAAAGTMLRDILVEWQPSQPGAAFPFKRMLPELAPKLVQKLKDLDYWDTYIETGFSATYSEHYAVVWLEALNHLWHKHTSQEKHFGLAEIGEISTFVTQPELEYKDVKIAHDPKEPRLGEFAKMSNEQFRVFVAGLVIDLIRLASEAAEDVKFWQDLSNFLGPKNS